ncbi:MAG: tetratricopeptide repeat protein [Candidatus Kariarchaeaceae archaeon]
MVLSRIKQLYAEGKYEVALNKIAETTNLDYENSLKIKLIESQIWMKKGEFDKSLHLLNEISTEAQKEDLELVLFQAMNVEVSVLRRLGKYKDGLEIIEKAEKISEETNRQDFEWQECQASILMSKGSLSYVVGDHDIAIASFEKALWIREILGLEDQIAASKNNLALIYQGMGNYELALKYFEESNSIFEKIDHKQNIAFTLNNIGLVHLNVGNTNQALNTFKKGLNILEDEDDDGHRSIIYSNLGNCYALYGEYEAAFTYYKMSMELKEKLGNPHHIAISYVNIADIYWFKGELDLAKKYFTEASIIAEENFLQRELVHSLLFSMLVHIDLKEDKDIQLCHKRLQSDFQKTEDPNIRLMVEVSHALFLKHQPRLADKMEALRLLRSIIHNKKLEFELLIFAVLELCDLLLFELKTLENEEVINEIEELLSRINDIAFDQNMYPTIVEICVLRAQLELYKFNPAGSKSLLRDAYEIAESKGLLRLKITISDLQERLVSSISNWDQILEENRSIERRIELTALPDLLHKVSRKKLHFAEIPQEKPVLFMIISKNGTTQYSKLFAETSIINDQLVGGFISAINSFIGEVFYEQDIIENIKFGDYNIVFKSFNTSIICYAFQGPSFSAYHKLDTLIERIQASQHILKSILRFENQGVQSGMLEIDTIVNQLFEGDQIFPDQTDEKNEDDKAEITDLGQLTQPLKLEKFRSLMHPIRLAILKTLHFQMRILRSELQKILSIASGTLERHLGHLIDNELISSSFEFYEIKPQKVVSITIKGSKLYEEFKQSISYVFE